MITSRTIANGLRLLAADPPLFFQYAKRRFLEAAVNPFFAAPLAFEKRMNGVVFRADFRRVGQRREIQGFVNEIYFDTFEPEILAYVKRVLRPGDVFVDVGASVGYISAVALSRVGEEGAVHSFEPLATHQESLQGVRLANPRYHLEVNRCALGESAGVLKMHCPGFPHEGGNSFVPGFLESLRLPVQEVVETRVLRLDDYLREKNIARVALVKIDVEGYEYPVIRGLRRYFETTGCRPDIICEVQPSAYPLLGCSLREFSDYMRRYGYRAHDLFNLKHVVAIENSEGKPGFNVAWRVAPAEKRR